MQDVWTVQKADSKILKDLKIEFTTDKKKLKKLKKGTSMINKNQMKLKMRTQSIIRKMMKSKNLLVKWRLKKKNLSRKRS